MTKLLTSFVLSAAVSSLLAQAPASAALARAQLIEQREGDLRAAEQEYRRLLAIPDAAPELRAATELQLGALLWRLDRRPEARPLLQRVVERGGDVGARARHILGGQDPQGRNEQEVALKVQDVIERMFNKMERELRGEPEQDLVWLGHAAVPELLRQIEARRAAAMEQLASLFAREQRLGPRSIETLMGKASSRTRAAEGLGEVLALLPFVWSIGGPDAQRYLVAATSDADVAWRRVVAFCSPAADASLLGLVETMLRDTDAEGHVPQLAMRIADRLPLDRLVPLFEAPIDSVREAAWRRMQEHPVWERGDADELDVAMTAVESRLRKALADPDPATARAAFQFLLWTGARAPRGAALLLERLPEVPVFDRVGWVSTGNNSRQTRQAEAHRAPLPLVVRCAERLGPWNDEDGLQPRRQFLREMASVSAADDPGQLLTLAELGYGVAYAAAAVDPGRAVDDSVLLRAGRYLLAHPDEGLAQRLWDRERLPATLIEPLVARLSVVLPAQPADAGDRDRTPAEARIHNEIGYLTEMLARTADPEAVERLRALRADQPIPARLVASVTLQLIARYDVGGVEATLRELLLDASLDPLTRNQLLAELARRGDEPAIEAYPRAVMLGLRESPGIHVRQLFRGARWLLDAFDNSSRVVPVHGYGDAALQRAWEVLLASPARDRALGEFRGVDLRVVPAVVRRVVLEHVAAHVGVLPAEFPADWPGVPLPAHRVGEGPWRRDELVARVVGWTSAAQGPSGVAMRAAALSLASDEVVGAAAVAALPREVVALMASELQPLLDRDYSAKVLVALRDAAVEVPVAAHVACMQRASAWSLRGLLQLMPSDAAPELVREVERQLGHPDGNIRMLACQTLGRIVAAESVAPLLPLLKDPQGEVRSAAREALQSIRLYHEQQRYWDSFQQGVVVGKEVAAAKLLAQARPGEPLQQRQLALGALGALGAPEALPYLIEWMGSETDEELKRLMLTTFEKISQAARKQ